MKHIILAIDDDRLILNTMQKEFSSWDYEVYTAESPAEAKEILDKVTPSIVLLDLLLTADDGSQEVMDFLKSQDRLKNIPVIVITNLDKPELRELMMQQGVKEFIPKGSLSLDQIHLKVMGYLEPQK